MHKSLATGVGAEVAAPVRVESIALSDPRIRILGKIARYNEFEALGRLIHLWSYCTDRASPIVHEAVVEGCLGAKGVEALLGSDLGERIEGGIRVRGTDAKRIEWHQDLIAKRVEAGKKRQETAQRDSAGRFTPPGVSENAENVQHPSSTHPAHGGYMLDKVSEIGRTVQHPSSTHPAQSSVPTPTPTPVPVPVPVPTQTPSGSSFGQSSSANASDHEAIPAVCSLNTPKKATKRSRSAPKTEIPLDWAPNASHLTKAIELGIDCAAQAEAFQAHARANGRVLVDWDQGFRMWLMKSAEWRRGPSKRESKANTESMLMDELGIRPAPAWGNVIDIEELRSERRILP